MALMKPRTLAAIVLALAAMGGLTMLFVSLMADKKKKQNKGGDDRVHGPRAMTQSSAMDTTAGSGDDDDDDDEGPADDFPIAGFVASAKASAPVKKAAAVLSKTASSAVAAGTAMLAPFENATAFTNNFAPY